MEKEHIQNIRDSSKSSPMSNVEMPRECCVPLCSTNCGPQGIAHVITFAFPKNEEQRQLWLKHIPMEDFVPGNSAAVCIKHFKEQFILREVTATRVKGVLVVQGVSTKLSVDAYPTIFEEYNKLPSVEKKLLSCRGRKTPTKRNKEESDTVTQTEPAISSNRGVTSDSEESHVTVENAMTIEVGENIQGSAVCPHCNISYNSKLQSHIASCQSSYEPRRNANIRKGAVSTSEASTQTLGNAMAKAVNNDSSRKEILTSNVVGQFKTLIHTGQTLYSCKECPSLFTSYIHLQVHKKIHPGSQPVSVETTTKFDETSIPRIRDAKKTKKLINYCCKVCQEVFQSFADLRVHKRSHPATKPYCCDVCGKCFPRAVKLKEHFRVHTKERPYHCEICGAKFALKGSLTAHRRVHTGERPFKCDICDTSFTVSAQLKVHVQSHTGEQPYSCTECSAEFRYPSSLIVHKRCHTGERPYSCTVCSAEFSRKISLLFHKSRHTGVRPFPCDLCDVSCQSKGDLKVHKRIHTGERPYRCEICRATFSHSSTFNDHKRRHAGERMFLCDACGVAFVTNRELKIHQRRHTGEQPYQCDICGVAFTQVGSLNTHKKRHKENKKLLEG